MKIIPSNSHVVGFNAPKNSSSSSKNDIVTKDLDQFENKKAIKTKVVDKLFDNSDFINAHKSKSTAEVIFVDGLKMERRSVEIYSSGLTSKISHLLGGSALFIPLAHDSKNGIYVSRKDVEQLLDDEKWQGLTADISKEDKIAMRFGQLLHKAKKRREQFQKWINSSDVGDGDSLNVLQKAAKENYQKLDSVLALVDLVEDKGTREKIKKTLIKTALEAGKDDRAFMSSGLEKYPEEEPLKYIGEKLKKDRIFMLQILSGPTDDLSFAKIANLKYLDISLKQNHEFIIDAIKKNKWLCFYVDKKLLDDAKFVEDLRKFNISFAPDKILQILASDEHALLSILKLKFHKLTDFAQKNVSYQFKKITDEEALLNGLENSSQIMPFISDQFTNDNQFLLKAAKINHHTLYRMYLTDNTQLKEIMKDVKVNGFSTRDDFYSCIAVIAKHQTFASGSVDLRRIFFDKNLLKDSIAPLKSEAPSDEEFKEILLSVAQAHKNTYAIGDSEYLLLGAELTEILKTVKTSPEALKNLAKKRIRRIVEQVSLEDGGLAKLAMPLALHSNRCIDGISVGLLGIERGITKMPKEAHLGNYIAQAIYDYKNEYIERHAQGDNEERTGSLLRCRLRMRVPFQLLDEAHEVRWDGRYVGRDDERYDPRHVMEQFILGGKLSQGDKVSDFVVKPFSDPDTLIDIVYDAIKNEKIPIESINNWFKSKYSGADSSKKKEASDLIGEIISVDLFDNEKLEPYKNRQTIEVINDIHAKKLLFTAEDFDGDIENLNRFNGLVKQFKDNESVGVESINLSSTVGSEAWNSRDLKSRPH